MLTNGLFYTMDEFDAMRIVCESIGEPSNEPPATPGQLDPERFKAYAKSPSDIDESVLRDIAAVIDGKRDVTPRADSTVPVATPSTLDRLLNAVTVVYITDNDFPVAAASLVDPTREDYRHIVPVRYYSLLTGYNLDGRVQQEFFAVADEYRNAGLGTELRAQVAALDTPTFVVADVEDRECIEGLARAGYQFVAQVSDGTSLPPVQVWIDNAGKTPADPENPDEPGDLENTVGLV